MLKRAGYSDGIEPNVHNGAETFSDEWWMSKRIARECALGPEPRLSPSGTAFCQVASVDFTEIEAHYPGPDLASTLFTVSSCCGRFLMAANGCLVYVYELNRSHKDCDDGATYPGLLRPVTSIICPRRVLACSMDTSSQRYAIALLLDGRMGLVCDIRVLSPDSAVGLDDGMVRASHGLLFSTQMLKAHSSRHPAIACRLKMGRDRCTGISAPRMTPLAQLPSVPRDVA